jgi:hypothetical protein
MKHKDKPPRKKVSSKRDDPETTDGKRPNERPAPAAAERTDPEPTTKAPEKEETPSSDRRSHPVTNQDEQDKITNAGNSDLPVADK